MPHLDGLDATRAIRLLPGWANIPILAMTANAFSDDRQACQVAGMNDFIAKPVDSKALYVALRKWLPLMKGRATADVSSVEPSVSHTETVAAPEHAAVVAVPVAGRERL